MKPKSAAWPWMRTSSPMSARCAAWRSCWNTRCRSRSHRSASATMNSWGRRRTCVRTCRTTCRLSPPCPSRPSAMTPWAARSSPSSRATPCVPLSISLRRIWNRCTRSRSASRAWRSTPWATCTPSRAGSGTTSLGACPRLCRLPPRARGWRSLSRTHSTRSTWRYGRRWVGSSTTTKRCSTRRLPRVCGRVSCPGKGRRGRVRTKPRTTAPR
mmetsp:Transcript_34805/g.109918  ORF Transcript_34805/g.109918 Transcript_34805/m.109918 type:complete len:213 (+) Transcript_34805:1054-1692(+)